MKQVIILFGPPGAGKGTQAELLSDKLGLFHFETSKILEERFKKAENLSKKSEERFFHIGDEKYDILNEKKLWDEGSLCSPPFVIFLVKEKIKEFFDSGKNLVLSGSPRTLLEAEELVPLLKELYGLKNINPVRNSGGLKNIQDEQGISNGVNSVRDSENVEDIRNKQGISNGVNAFFIEISPEETIFRNSHRKVCELMRHSILYNKETEKLNFCPLDGSKLLKRELDDPKTIKVRLREYKERTFPVLEYLEKEGIEIKKINGEQSVADVFKDILEKLK